MQSFIDLEWYHPDVVEVCRYCLVEEWAFIGEDKDGNGVTGLGLHSGSGIGVGVEDGVGVGVGGTRKEEESKRKDPRLDPTGLVAGGGGGGDSRTQDHRHLELDYYFLVGVLEQTLARYQYLLEAPPSKHKRNDRGGRPRGLFSRLKLGQKVLDYMKEHFM